MKIVLNPNCSDYVVQVATLSEPFVIPKENQNEVYYNKKDDTFELRESYRNTNLMKILDRCEILILLSKKVHYKYYFNAMNEDPIEYIKLTMYKNKEMFPNDITKVEIEYISDEHFDVFLDLVKSNARFDKRYFIIFKNKEFQKRFDNISKINERLRKDIEFFKQFKDCDKCGELK